MNSYRIVYPSLAIAMLPLAFDQSPDEQEVFMLSPFQVDGSQDQGYRARNSISATRLNAKIQESALGRLFALSLWIGSSFFLVVGLFAATQIAGWLAILTGVAGLAAGVVIKRRAANGRLRAAD